MTRARNRDLERELVAVAARAAERTHDGGLLAYADVRALPGGVRTDADWDQEAREELADCCSYLVWGIESVYDAYLAGDPTAGSVYARRMSALVAVVRAWHELHT